MFRDGYRYRDLTRTEGGRSETFQPPYLQGTDIYSKGKQNTMTNPPGKDEARLNLYIKFLKERLFFDPSSETLHYNLGLAYTQKGQVEEAISEFKQALECNPGLAQAHVNLGGLYMGTDPARSIQENLRALEIDPNLGPAHSNLAFCYLREGKLEMAIEHGGRALELMPASKQAVQLLVSALLEAGRPQQAADLSMKMIEEDGSFAPAHVNLAAALRALGRDREADEHMKKARELGYAGPEDGKLG